MTESIDSRFRWIDDISIELAGKRPGSKLQLTVSADIGRQKYEIRTSKERTIRRVSNEKMFASSLHATHYPDAHECDSPCSKTKEIVIELFEYRRKYVILKKKAQILFMNLTLKEDELYTEKIYTSDDNGAKVTVAFAYSPGGDLREQVEEARRITEEQKIVLDKIRHIHLFFQGLESVCEAIEDIHPYVKVASTAVLSLYKLCEKQKEYRDAVRGLVDEMSDLLDNGLEKLSDLFRTRVSTRAAFKLVTDAVEDISEFVKEQNKEMMGSLRDALSAEPRIEELRDKFRRAKAGLNDSITYGLWELAVDDHLKNDLKFVSNAYYQRGAGCLPGTRVGLLAGVDTWVRDSKAEKMAWIHGYAGSGKSALLNSIARNLEKAYIPFTCFTCKRDDAERSNVQRILSTICYGLTRNYGDYRGKISSIVQQQEGLSITTGDVATQMELLFGESPSYGVISPKHARRPPVHVLLIDALDECKNVRERIALARHLRELAGRVPWVKVIITSRPESDIADFLANTNHSIRCINVNDEEWKTSADIRLFVEAKSKEHNLGLSSDQLDRFQEKASGLFIWCTTVFRYIEESKKSKSRTIADVLKDHPPESNDSPHAPLYSLYQHVLESTTSLACDRELMETILGVLFVASGLKPLSAIAITDILFPDERGKELDEKRVWVANIIKSLFAIIYIEEGETNAVRACHPSVLDFIGGMLNGLTLAATTTGENVIRPFPARLEEIHSRVFNGCLTVMNHELRFNICSLDDSFYFNNDIPDLSVRIKQNLSEALQYGCLFWVYHLKQAEMKNVSEKVFALLNTRMALFWIEALSLLDAVDRCIVALQDCAQIFVAEPNVAQIANEWERFLLAYGDASQSTPHLYLSALSWIPDTSPLWSIVRSSFSPELPMVSNGLKAWRGERWSENIGTEVRSVAYSHDGRLFAAGCIGGSIRFWEARSRKKEREPFITEGHVSFVAFSPDSRWLVSGHKDGTVRLWNLRAVSVTPRELEGHTDEIGSIAFSCDGKRLVTGSRDATIGVWDIESGTAIIEPFETHDSVVTSVTFSADNRRIITSSLWWLSTWNAETGERIGELLEGSCVACSRDGRLMVSGSYNGIIRLWDAQTYEQIAEFGGHTGFIFSIRLSSDSKHIAFSTGDYSVRVWSVDTCSLVNELNGHTDTVMSIAFSPDGRSLLSGSWDGTIRIWDPKEIVPVNQPPEVNLARLSCISYVPGSNVLVSIHNGNLDFWDTQTGSAVGKPIRGFSIIALAVSNDGQWLVSASSDCTLRIWDIALRTPVGEPMRGHTRSVTSIAVSPDNRVVASASKDKTIRLWDVTTRESVWALKGHEGVVTSVTFSGDGNNIISGSVDHTIRTWDIRTGEAVGQPSRIHLDDWAQTMAVSSDGEWIASGSDDITVRIWSTSTHRDVHLIGGHSHIIRSVAFSPDSKFLISGSQDRTVRIWNVQTREAIGDALTGHTAGVFSVVFAPGGNEFASASDDGAIRVWDTRARTDLEMQRENPKDYDELGDKELLIRWNACRACAANNNGWVKDRGKLLLWVPWQYRSCIYGGTKSVICARDSERFGPQVDYNKMFRYSGKRWKDVFTGKNIHVYGSTTYVIE